MIAAKDVLWEIVKKYDIDVESTQRVQLSGLRPTTRIFEVTKPGLTDDLLKLYILDTPEARRIACYQWIVGRELLSQSHTCAREAAKVILRLSLLGKLGPSSGIHLHVLRASPGYMLHKAMATLFGKKLREAYVRPEYVDYSYRDHTSSERPLRVTYRDFGPLPSKRDFVVIKPDTEATGRTGQVALEEMAKECEKAESSIRELVLYGFIADEALERLKEVSKTLNIRRIIALALENVPRLANNKYDMTAYGPDEGLWSLEGRVENLGSIMDATTLLEFIPEFVPGLDQPGDFSERQQKLFDGQEWARGDMSGHLKKTISVIESIRSIPDCLEPWQDNIARRELERLNAKLKQIEGRGG